MSLTTLAALKTSLGITDTSEDAMLTQWLRGASALIRRYVGRYLGGVVSTISLANPTVVTAIGHGLESGDVIVISGSGPGTSIDGDQTITRIDDDTFTVPVNVTVAGTRGNYIRKLTEFYEGTGQRELLLREYPVQSVASVYEDSGGYFGDGTDAFASGTLLTAGSDYVLRRDSGSRGKSGILYRLAGAWPAVAEFAGGMLTPMDRYGLGNIKVTYTAGYTSIPWDIREALTQLVSERRRALATGGSGAMQSETFDYYSYTRMSAEEAGSILGSAANILKGYRPQIW